MINTLKVSNTQLTNNMKGSVGMLAHDIRSNRDYLSFKSFDLSDNNVGSNGLASDPNIMAKVTMLLYNRISPDGRILSSVVYCSVPHPVDDTATVFGYDAKTSLTKTSMTMPWELSSDVENFSYINSFRPSEVLVPSRDRSLFTEAVNALTEYGRPSHVVGDNTYVKDGWYTLVSMGIVNENVEASQVFKGLWIYESNTGDIYIAKQDHTPTSQRSDTALWNKFDVWTDDTSIAIAPTSNFLFNPWVSKDFMWLSTLDAIYTDAVLDYIKTVDQYSAYPSLRVNTRVINQFLEYNKFPEAQYVLQTTDHLRTTYNFTQDGNY